MTESCTYISNVHVLEQFNDTILCVGDAMENIDKDVANHFNNVKYTLERKLGFFQEKLEEATKRMNEAAEEMSSCHARQHPNQDGELVPSCSHEERVFADAQNEMYKWKYKYERAKQIVEDCHREISSYYTVEHNLILNMCNRQTPRNSRLLVDIIAKIYAILNCNLELQTYTFSKRQKNERHT